MILLLDLGNTNLYVGVYQNGSLKGEYRTDSDLTRSTDMWEIILKNFFTSSSLDTSEFEGAILSSVIPALTYSIQDAVERIVRKPCMVISNSLKSGLCIRCDNPSEVGADLIADCVGANKKYSYPSIICDMGTCTKLLVVDKSGAFMGSVFFPGLKTAQKALSNNAAQLFDISFKAPKKVIGKNTADCLNSGAIYGNIAAIEGLTEMIEKELGYTCHHILTGGNAILIKDHINDYIYDKTLIFEGLYQIYLKNTNNN